MKDLQNELLQYEFDMGLKEKIMLDGEEEQNCKKLLEKGESLPQGVFETGYNTFYRVESCNLTETEIERLLVFKKIQLLKVIKNCIAFFVVLTALSIFGVFMLIMK